MMPKPAPLVFSGEWSEPMAGRCHPQGTLIHAVQELPGPWFNTCTRRAVCGAGRGETIFRNFGRYFDPFDKNVCPKCVKIIAAWWAERVSESVAERR
jgi:hypothetical protein